MDAIALNTLLCLFIQESRGAERSWRCLTVAIYLTSSCICLRAAASRSNVTPLTRSHCKLKQFQLYDAVDKGEMGAMSSVVCRCCLINDLIVAASCVYRVMYSVLWPHQPLAKTTAHNECTKPTES